MSCWIEFHPTRIKRLQKFSDFRRDLSLSVNEALGLLGSFWGEVLELAESGDISAWSAEYITERAGSSLNPERVLAALVKHRWIDVREDGKRLIHDWIDCAGTFLRGKYAGSNRPKLEEIWAIHGRVYGQKGESDKPPIGSQLGSNRKPRTPKKVEVGKGDPGDVKGGSGESEGGPREIFEAARKAFPGIRRGSDVEWENFEKKFGARKAEILPLLLPAIRAYKAHHEKKSRQEGRPPLWAHFTTWINQERWTAEYPGQVVATDEAGKARAQAHYREHGFYPSGTPSDWYVS